MVVKYHLIPFFNGTKFAWTESFIRTHSRMIARRVEETSIPSDGAIIVAETLLDGGISTSQPLLLQRM